MEVSVGMKALVTSARQEWEGGQVASKLYGAESASCCPQETQADWSLP